MQINCQMDLIIFEKNGKLFIMMFGLKYLMDKYHNNIYSGMFDELKLFYNNNTCSKKLSKSIKLIFGNTKLEYMTIDRNQNVIPLSNGIKTCPFCHSKRNNTFYHLGWLCREVSTASNLTWSLKKNYSKNINFLEGLQERVDKLFS